MSASPDDDDLAFVASGGTTPHPLKNAANDATAAGPDTEAAFIESGGTTAHPLGAAKSSKPEKTSSMGPDYWERQAAQESEANVGASEVMAHLASGALSSTIGGIRYATGADKNISEEQRQKNLASLVYEPRTEAGQLATRPVETAASYTGAAEGKAIGPRATDWATAAGLPPSVAGAIGAGAETLANVPQFLIPAGIAKARGRFAPGADLTETGAPRATAAEPGAAPTTAPAAPVDLSPAGNAANETKLGIKPEKAEDPTQPATTGNLADAQQQERQALAQRLGFNEVRTSALEGDAQAAADDYDSTKFTGEPMGERMRGVIKDEKQKLSDATESIVDDAGGRVGTDQTTMKAKGKTMAAPVEGLRTYLDNATSDLYNKTSERFGSNSVGNLDEVDTLLKDPDFREQLLSTTDGTALLGSIERQYARFKGLRPDGGFTVDSAEGFRKFLNNVWTPENARTLGQVKGAVDTGVFKNAGEDIYGPARKLSQTRKTLLDDPDGMSMFDRDPKKPLNRATAYEDIPNKLVDLSSDQFDHIMQTYRNMPPELKPLGDAAISEVQGHMANRLLDAGTKGADIQWNKKNVNAELSANSENFNTAFKNRPDLAARIQDVKNGGEMFRFNSGYRGAYAQTRNMQKAGIGSKAVTGAAAATGAGIGGYVAGPLGTVPGAAAGRALAGKGLETLEKSRQIKAAEARVTKLD